MKKDCDFPNWMVMQTFNVRWERVRDLRFQNLDAKTKNNILKQQYLRKSKGE